MNKPDEHPVDETALRRGHEVRETNVGLIVKLGVGLALLTGFSMLLMWGMFVWLEDYHTSQFEASAPLVEAGQLPPEPRLQVIPEKDLVAMRAAEKEKLENYDWVIREAGIVRIPIKRAMELTVERGLAARPEASGAPSK